MPDIEIRIKTIRDGKDAIKEIGKDAKDASEDLKKLAKNADIVGKVDLDTDDINRLNKELEEAQAEAKKLLALADNPMLFNAKFKVDESELKRAEATVRDLDSIPPPEVRIETNAEEAVADAEGAFNSIDFSNAGKSMVDQFGSILSVAGPIGGVITAFTAAFGDDVAEGINKSLQRRKNDLIDAVRFGLDDHQLKSVGVAAGEAWSSGFGEGLEEVRQTAGLLENTLRGLDSSLDLSEATRQAEALAQVYGIDVTQSIELARRMVSNGLARDTEQAFAIMADAAQKYQLDAEEILDVMTEFAPVFGKLGVDGARAMDIIGTAVGEGLLPNVDRAAELFEEFNIEITDTAGRAKPVIEELGLSFEDMQDKLASGRGAEAMAEVATALLNVGDEAERNRMAIELFGTSIESASDPERVLELLATADSVGEVGTAMEDATKAIEESQTGWDQAKKAAMDYGAVIGGEVNTVLEVFFDLLKGNPLDAFKSGLEGVKDTFLTLTDAVGLTSEADRVAADDFEDLRQKAIEQADAFDYNVSAQDELHGALNTTQSEMNEAEDATDAAAEAIEELDRQFEELQGRFDGDKAIRNLYENIDQLSSETIGATGDIYDMGTGFDLTTEEGRKYSSQLEDLHSDLLDVAQGHRDGSVTAAELARAQSSVESQLRQVASQLGLTEEETQQLIDAYGEVPADVHTQIDLQGNAMDRTRQLIADLKGLDGKQVTTYINTHSTYTGSTAKISTRRLASGGISTAAEGGARGGLVLVGEQGPELVDMPFGSMVHTNADTQHMLQTSMGGGGGVTLIINVAGSIRSDRDIEEIVTNALRRGGIDSYGLQPRSRR